MIHEQKTEVTRNTRPACPFEPGDVVECIGARRVIREIRDTPAYPNDWDVKFVDGYPDGCLWPTGGHGNTLRLIERPKKPQPACPFKVGDWINPFKFGPKQVESVEACDPPKFSGYTHMLTTDDGTNWFVPDAQIVPCDPPDETAEPPQHRPDPTGTYVAELFGCLLDSIHLTRNRIRVELERCYSTRANANQTGGTVDYGAFLRVQTLVNKLLGDLADEANRIDELAEPDDEAVSYGG